MDMYNFQRQVENKSTQICRMSKEGSKISDFLLADLLGTKKIKKKMQEANQVTKQLEQAR